MSSFDSHASFGLGHESKRISSRAPSHTACGCGLPVISTRISSKTIAATVDAGRITAAKYVPCYHPLVLSERTQSLLSVSCDCDCDCGISMLCSRRLCWRFPFLQDLIRATRNPLVSLSPCPTKTRASRETRGGIFSEAASCA